MLKKLAKLGESPIMKKLTILMPLFILAFCIFFTAKGFAAPTAFEQRALFIEHCKTYLGTPYKYGGLTKNGMDCSGFIYTAAKESIELKLPRRSEDLYLSCEKISKDEMQPGDFLFFKASTRINHAAVYIGNGEFIHAASDGPKTGVVISTFDENYWARTYTASGRILPEVSSEEVILLESKDQKPAENAKTEEIVALPKAKKDSVDVSATKTKPAEKQKPSIVVESKPNKTEENQNKVQVILSIPGSKKNTPIKEEIAPIFSAIESFIENELNVTITVEGLIN